MINGAIAMLARVGSGFVPRFSARSDSKSASLDARHVGQLGDGETMRLQISHHLLPHERWFAELVLEQRRSRPTRTALRLERKYGPEGNALLSAAHADMLPGCLTYFAGTALVILSGGRAYLAVIGLALYVIGLALVIGGGIRAIQSAHAGRVFRSNRTFTESSKVSETESRATSSESMQA
jgi:hypothetical protein